MVKKYLLAFPIEPPDKATTTWQYIFQLMYLRAATAILKLRDRHTEVLALGQEVPSPARQKLCSMPLKPPRVRTSSLELGGILLYWLVEVSESITIKLLM